MDRVELRQRVGDLSVWRNGDQRAPHKPLLLLWALGRCAAGRERLAPYAEIDEQLSPLLEEFGPPRRTYHTEYPFWYLRNDGLWEVHGTGEARIREGKASQPARGELIRVGAVGGLVPEAFELVRSDRALLYEIANRLVDAHFADTMREEILSAVGLDDWETIQRRRRDPAFRADVLIAYGYRCAVCSFDARMRTVPLAIEAAHIRWHQAGGPDRVANGLGLCSLHHTLFDRGAFTLSYDLLVVVSGLVNGGEATEQALFRFDGSSIQLPRSEASQPHPEFLGWHRREVFKGDGSTDPLAWGG
jgi:putative restriction endonuclease